MDRPRPAVGLSLASIIMGKFSAAKLAVKEIIDEKRVAAPEVNNRESRRFRSRNNWRFRSWFGIPGIPGSKVLRGYRGRYTNSLSAYVAEQQLHRHQRQSMFGDYNIRNSLKRERKAAR
jgi:hypothetical protein